MAETDQMQFRLATGQFAFKIDAWGTNTIVVWNDLMNTAAQ